MCLVQKYYGEPVPEFARCVPEINRGMIFTDDKGQSFRFEQEGLNVWRSSFDKWLADKAAEVGVEVRDGTSALSCEENEEYVDVTLKAEKICSERAKYVIDCEGVSGLLKKKLLGEEPKLIYTYQTFNKGSIDLDYQFFHAYLQPELSEYDAWFNVKDNQLVLGISVKDIDKTAYYYDQFTDYMKKNHGLRIEKQLKVDKWLMPHIQPGCCIDYGAGRVLFAGEIAGFLNPMGEGISAGIESGYHAGMAIAGNFDDPDIAIDEYRNRVSELYGYMRRQWELVAGMASTFKEMGRIEN